MNELKPGYKTTEFYITLAGLVLGLLVGNGVLSEENSNVIMQILALLIPALLPVAYTLARTWLKNQGK